MAGVIEMGMREHDSIDGRRVDAERLPVPEPEVLLTLEQPGVDEDTCVRCLDQEPAARDRSSRAQEGERSTRGRRRRTVGLRAPSTSVAAASEVEQGRRSRKRSDG
jgi:hypothetical protein